MARSTVLVTGMSGLIGGALRSHLAARYELRALNRRPVEGAPCHQAHVADLEAIQPASKGVDAVVHLAASVGMRAPFDGTMPARGATATSTTRAPRSGCRRSTRRRPTASRRLTPPDSIF